MADFLEPSLTIQPFDVVFKPVINSFRGRDRLQMRVYDMKTSDSLDNPRTFSYHIQRQEQPFFERLEDCIMEGISGDLPVLIVYPTVRCLEKHLPGLKRRFSGDMLTPIHGCLSEAVRRRNLQRVESRRKQVLLTTDVFFRYGLSNRNYAKDGGNSSVAQR